MKLIKIEAMWCMSCLYMNEVFRKAMNEYKGNIEVINYDYDTDTDIVYKYNIGSILPVYILINNDKEIGRLEGEHSKEELLQLLGGYHEK